MPCSPYRHDMKFPIVNLASCQDVLAMKCHWPTPLPSYEQNFIAAVLRSLFNCRILRCLVGKVGVNSYWREEAICVNVRQAAICGDERIVLDPSSQSWAIIER